MAYVLSKPRSSKPPAQTKICLHCNQTKPLTNFFANRNWVDNGGKDAWCKQCIAKIRTKDEMRRYFWENNRQWLEHVWENALKNAELDAVKSTAYQRSNEDRRQILLEAMACPKMPSLMQKTQNYKYEDHTNDPYANNYDEAKEGGKIIEFDSAKPKDKNLKTYNEFFNGEFKPSELEYLEKYYQGLEQDFNLSDTALRDTAKKVAKASLLADKAQNDYMSGRGSLQDVKDANAVLDLLMKTGNFAACKRKADDKTGMSSWSELTLHLETHGFLADKLVYWDQDDVDKTINEFRYITEAIGLEG